MLPDPSSRPGDGLGCGSEELNEDREEEDEIHALEEATRVHVPTPEEAGDACRIGPLGHVTCRLDPWCNHVRPIIGRIDCFPANKPESQQSYKVYCGLHAVCDPPPISRSWLPNGTAGLLLQWLCSAVPEPDDSQRKQPGAAAKHLAEFAELKASLRPAKTALASAPGASSSKD